MNEIFHSGIARTTNTLISLDGSQGEGGGQILRSALALSLVTGRAFRITSIRARRPKPGLMRQHLACVNAAKRIGSAIVEGASLGSKELVFRPGGVEPGDYEFKIGSAGSTLLLMQTILPPLLLADRPSKIQLEGGTHNPFAPPFPFIEQAFLPLLRRIGFHADATLTQPGFYPNGGGRCQVSVQPAHQLQPLHLEKLNRTQKSGIQLFAEVCLVGLPQNVAERELKVIQQRLGIPPDNCSVNRCDSAIGPGNTVHVRATWGEQSEVFTGFGAPKISAESVAEESVKQAEQFLQSGAVVGEHLADQLLLPLALARGGSFVTTQPSEHTRTNARIIREFLETDIGIHSEESGRWIVEVEGRKTS